MKTNLPMNSAKSSPLDEPSAALRPPTLPTASDFRSMLRETARELAAGDRMLAEVVSRGPSAPALDSHRLLELQAGMYRYSQQLELAGRVVDRTTQAVKTTLQSQG